MGRTQGGNVPRWDSLWVGGTQHGAAPAILHPSAPGVPHSERASGTHKTEGDQSMGPQLGGLSPSLGDDAP